MIPNKPVPGLIREGYRLSEKIMRNLKILPRIWMRNGH